MELLRTGRNDDTKAFSQRSSPSQALIKREGSYAKGNSGNNQIDACHYIRTRCIEFGRRHAKRCRDHQNRNKTEDPREMTREESDPRCLAAKPRSAARARSAASRERRPVEWEYPLEARNETAPVPGVDCEPTRRGDEIDPIAWDRVLPELNQN